MKKAKTLLLLCTLSFVMACNSENSSNQVAQEQNKEKFDSTAIKNDAEFALKATSSGLLEVEMGAYAAANAASPKVKAYGQTMSIDHNKVNNALKTLTTSKNITIPAVPDNNKQRRMDDLKKKKGADFDREYIDLMISYHREDLDFFQREIEKGNDPELKALAISLVPALNHHLQMAEEIKKDLTK